MWTPWLIPRPMPLRETAAGGFPVPESIGLAHLPPNAQLALLRLVEAPPKPSVTPAVMNEAEHSMIAPVLPFRSYW